MLQPRWKLARWKGRKTERRRRKKAGGSRLVLGPSGVPAQDLEADTGRPVTARDDQIEGFRSRKLDKDRKGVTTKTPSDQDQDDGVLQQATGPTPLQDETVGDDDEKNEMSTPKECKTYKKKKKKTKYTETREEAERDGCAGAGLLGARGAVGSVQDQVKDANGSLEMETVQSVYRRDEDVLPADRDTGAGDAEGTGDTAATADADGAAAMLAGCTDDCSVVRLATVGVGNVLSTPDAGGERAERAEALRSRSPAGGAMCATPEQTAQSVLTIRFSRRSVSKRDGQKQSNIKHDTRSGGKMGYSTSTCSSSLHLGLASMGCWGLCLTLASSRFWGIWAICFNKENVLKLSPEGP